MRDSDKFIKVLLVIIAVLLFVIAIQLGFNISVNNNAVAANWNVNPEKAIFKLESIGTIKADGIKDIKLLQDQRTFILQLKDEAVLYRIVKEEK